MCITVRSAVGIIQSVIESCFALYCLHWVDVGAPANKLIYTCGGPQVCVDMKGQGHNSEGAEMLCHELCDPVRPENEGIGYIQQALFHVQPPPFCHGFRYDNGILI